MQIKGNHVIFEQHEDPERQRVPPTLIASGRTRWDKKLPDGSTCEAWASRGGMLLAAFRSMRCRSLLFPWVLSCLVSACDSGGASSETDGTTSDTETVPEVPAVCDEAPEVEVDCGLIQGCSADGDSDETGGGSSGSGGSGGTDGCTGLEQVQQCVLEALAAGQSLSYSVQESPGGQFDYTRSYRVATDGRVWWSSAGWGDLCYDSSSGVRQGDAYGCTDWACAASAIEGGASVADCGSESMCEDGV